MSLAIQTASFPFARGISDRSDGLQTPPPQLATLENAVFDIPGRLTKRFGHRALSRRVVGRDAPLSSVQAEMTYGEELVCCDRERLYSYDPAENAWLDKGHLQSLYCTQQSVIRDNSTQTAQDEATHPSGIKVSAWEQSDGAYYTVINANTGQSIKGPTLIAATAIKPKTVVIGNFIALFWYDTAAFIIRGATIPTANPTAAITRTDITANLSDDASVSQTAPNFDMCVAQTTAGQQLYLAFNNAAGGTSIWRFLANNPVSVVSTLVRAADPSVVINIFADLYVGGPVLHWYDGSSVYFAAYDSNLLTELGTGLILNLGDVPFITPVSPIIKSLTGVSVSDTEVDLQFFGTIGTNAVTAPRSIVDDPLQNVVYRAEVTGGTQMSILSYMVGTPWMDRISYALTGTSTTGGQFTLLSYMVGTPTSAGGSSPSAGAGAVKLGVGLACKAFAYNGRAYVVVAYQSPPSAVSDVPTIAAQNAYMVLNEDGDETAKLLPGLGGGIPSRTDGLGQAPLAEVSNVTDSVRRFPLLATDQIVIGFSSSLATITPGSANQLTIQTHTGVVSNAVDFFNPMQSYLRAECGRTLNVSGGFLAMYDGLEPVELGYHVAPEMPVLSSALVAFDADGLGAGTYTYVATEEWTDNQGQTHRSSPSIIRQITLAPGNYPDPHVTVAVKYRVTVVVNTLHLTQKENVRIGIYRTAGSLNGTGFANVGYVDNNANEAFYVSFTDTLPDSGLGYQPLLYAQPDGTGELQNVPPGPVTSLAVYANRLIALSSVDPLKVWFSKQCIPSDTSTVGTPVEFTQSFQLTCDPSGGDVVALASLDDKLAFLKRYSIYAVTGQGPAANGTDSDFTIPTLVTTACGCSNPRSVTATPHGILFQTDKGYWQLTRGLVATFTGADANNYSRQSVTSGLTVPNTTQVRLTLAPSPENQIPTALMFDYYAAQWGTFTNIAAVDATIWRGQYVWMRSDGTAFVETPDLFTDAGQFIRMRLSTSWFRMAGLEGFQRVWKVMLLGTFRSAHTLKVRFAYDNNPAFVQDLEQEVTGPTAWGSDSSWGGGAQGDSPVWGGEFPAYEWILPPAHQACEALKLFIEDAPLYGYPAGESASFSALSFEYGTDKGLNRKPAKATIG